MPNVTYQIPATARLLESDGITLAMDLKANDKIFGRSGRPMTVINARPVELDGASCYILSSGNEPVVLEGSAVLEAPDGAERRLRDLAAAGKVLTRPAGPVEFRNARPVSTDAADTGVAAGLRLAYDEATPLSHRDILYGNLRERNEFLRGILVAEGSFDRRMPGFVACFRRPEIAALVAATARSLGHIVIRFDAGTGTVKPYGVKIVTQENLQKNAFWPKPEERKIADLPDGGLMPWKLKSMAARRVIRGVRVTCGACSPDEQPMLAQQIPVRF